VATRGFSARQAIRDYDAATAGDWGQYYKTLQQATYGALGPEFSQGLGQINNWAAGSGPLADSGAPTALRMKLAGDIYGKATGRIQQGASDFLRQMLEERRRYAQGIYGQKFQQDMQPSGFGGFAGKALGAGLGYLSAGALAPKAPEPYTNSSRGWGAPAPWMR
jgi:hypothetical protein